MRSYYLTTKKIMKLLSVIIAGRCISIPYIVTYLKIEFKKIYKNWFIDINIRTEKRIIFWLDIFVKKKKVTTQQRMV